MSKTKDEKIREAQGQKSRQTARLNAIRVLLTLLEKPLTFSELLKETGFSKPVLAKHVRTWIKENAIYKDTIKPDETANPMEVGKIIYRSVSKDIIPDIVTAIEKTLGMPNSDWDEGLKAELKKHYEGIAKVMLKEWEKRWMSKRAKLKPKIKTINSRSIETCHTPHS
jgi:DNA-binding transcriptional regulator GbsR (MarR family)